MRSRPPDFDRRAVRQGMWPLGSSRGALQAPEDAHGRETRLAYGHHACSLAVIPFSGVGPAASFPPFDGLCPWSANSGGRYRTQDQPWNKSDIGTKLAGEMGDCVYAEVKTSFCGVKVVALVVA